MTKRIFLSLFISLFISVYNSNAQNSFVDYQKSFIRVSDAFRKKEDSLKKQFEEKDLVWPAKYVYIRSFKYDSELELWVKDRPEDSFTLFKTYKVCALAGTMGPKRIQGDFQVPEGFYYINEFKHNSQYHLSLGLNYPNFADRLLADTYQPGGDIYIHGSCVTTGCIPITNQQIEEVYIIASLAKSAGQDFIPVHIYPVKFNNQNSAAYLEKLMGDDDELKKFEKPMKQAYDIFETSKQLPIISINPKGEYIIF